jgi:hypothetical protein
MGGERPRSRRDQIRAFKTSQLDPSAGRATPNDLQAQIEVESKGYLPFVGPIAIPLHTTTYFDVKLTSG